MIGESGKALSAQLPEGDNREASLANTALPELVAARGNPADTKAAFLRYFRRGLTAGLPLHAMMAMLPKLFGAVDYPIDEGRRVLEMLKALSLAEIGVQPNDEEIPE